MTDIVPSTSGPLAPRGSSSDQKAAKVRDALSRVRAQYLSVFDSIEGCRQRHEQRSREQMMQGARPLAAFLAPELRAPDQPKTEEDRDRELRVLEGAFARQPALADLGALREKAQEASAAPYASAPTRLVVGLMINAYPNARPHSPESYQEAVVDQLAATGFGPAPIAKACNQLVRTSAFVPSPAEVVTAATAAQDSLRAFVSAVDNFGAMAEWAGQAKEWIEKVPLLDDSRSNADRFPDPPRYSFEWARRAAAAGRVSWV